MTDISAFQETIGAWAVAKGWIGEGAPVKSFSDDIVLMHTELSEAVEAFRDSHQFTENWYTEDQNGNKKPEGVPSELADVIIRILQFSALHGIDMEEAVREKVEYNWTRSHRHGGKAL